MQQEFLESLEREADYIGQVRTTRYPKAKDTVEPQDKPQASLAHHMDLQASRAKWQSIWK